MTDLAEATALRELANCRDHPGADGCFEGALSADWEIWGPMGGYVAAVALRAAGAVSPFERPASFFCHYLAVGAFEPVHLTARVTRSARTAHACSVTMTQAGRTLLEASVWSVGTVHGLEHDVAPMPDVAGPDALQSWEEVRSDDGPSFPFWNNLEARSITWSDEWPPSGPLDPTWQTWLRFRPRSTFDDPWLDAARALVMLDVSSWPSGSRPHQWAEPPFIAPSLDLYVSFHRPAPADPWLLVDSVSPVAAQGLMAWNGRLWTKGGSLVATGAGQALFRRIQSEA